MSSEVAKRNIVLLGDASVGKTSLIRRFVMDQFSDQYITTIGSKVTKKELTLLTDDKKTDMTLMVWDIIGQKGYRYTQALSFKGMHGAFLVADLTRKESLESLRSYWIPLILKMAGPVPMIFLGNKADLDNERQYGIKDIEKIAATCTAFGAQDICYITSAKTGAYVEEAFRNIATLARTPRPKTFIGPAWNLMDLNEVGSLKDMLDHIITDFSLQYGGIANATPVIKHQMVLSNLDLTSPTESSVLIFIDRLSKIEACFKTPDEVEQNRMNRLRLFGYRKQ